MKNLFFLFISFTCITSTYAQIGIKADATTPIPSAQLEVQSTTKAFYPPRMNTSQRITLPNPPQKGAVVFDTDLNGLFVFNGSSWVSSGLTLPYSSTQNEENYNLLRVENTSTTTSYPVIIGVTNTASSSSAIIGSANNQNPTGFSCGVRGSNFSTNANGYGILGEHYGSGYGVAGAALNGTGVLGFSSNGIGGNFYSTSGYALITGTGNVGIGKPIPTEKLDIDGIVLTEGGGAGFRFNDRATNAKGFQWYTTGGNAYLFRHHGTAGNVMSVLENGNIGFGTSTPNAPLQFSNSALNRKIVLYETANNDHQFYGLGINGFTFRYQVDGTTASHVFYAATNTTTSNELMRIKGDGNVGIGTPTPNEKLEVNGNIRASSLAGTGVRDVKADANGNLTTTATQSKYYSANPYSFILENSDGSSVAYYNNSRAYTISGTVSLKCPLSLPHGATVTNVRIYYNDYDLSNDLTFSFDRIVFPNSFGNEGSASSSGSNSAFLSLDIPITPFTINNLTTAYQITVRPKTGGSVWTNGPLSVRGVVITYTE